MADKPNRPEGSPASRARAASAKLRAEQEAKQRRRSLMLQAAVVGVVVVVVIGITFAVLKANGSATKVEGTPPNIDANGSIFVGDEAAPVTLTLIEDFQCPVCKQFEDLNKDLLDKYAAGSEVRLEYRPIAFLDRMSSTEYSSRALNAAACVAATDPADWRTFHEALYTNQPAEQSAGLTDDALISMAVDAGAQQSDVASCIKDRTYDDWVQSTTDATTKLKDFEGTPTVLVNGTKVDTPTPEAIEAMVAAAK